MLGAPFENDSCLGEKRNPVRQTDRQTDRQYVNLHIDDDDNNNNNLYINLRTACLSVCLSDWVFLLPRQLTFSNGAPSINF